MIRLVQYKTRTLLDCGCTPADVRVCIPAVLAAVDVPTDGTYAFIEAQISAFFGCGSSCGPITCGKLYTYNLTYDDIQLASYDVTLQAATVPLTCENINGLFCIDCQTRYFTTLQGIVTSVSDTESIDLTVTDGDLTADAIISAFPMNGLTILPDGLYVPTVSALGIAVLDTNTVDLTLAAGPTISADVIISPDAGNCLTALANGLFVACPCVSDSTSIDFDIDGGGCITGDVIVSGNPGNLLQSLASGLFITPTVLDTSTINFGVTPLGEITGSVNISANPGNIITAVGDGIYATPVVADTNTVDLTVALGVISADVEISPNPGNLLTALVNGLYVTSCVLDTATIDFSVTALGCVTGSVKISANAGNVITAVADGLFLGVTDSATINFTPGVGDITGSVIISPDSFNLLEAHGNGLWVPATDGWIPFNATLTFVSANSFSLVGDWTDRLAIGDRLKLTDGTVKYFNVIARVFALGITTVTITAGIDFTLSGGAITAPFFSHDVSPVNFPHFFNWTPTYTASPGTFTIVTTDIAKFRIISSGLFFQLEASGTTAGNPTRLIATLPLTASDAVGALAAWADNGTGTPVPAAGIFHSATQGATLFGYSNGAARQMALSGSYRFA